MKIGSLFDGSGGFPLAFSICGFEPVWAAEVEPYPIAVTRSRFPNMKHLGNVSLVDGAEIEPVDVITFGAPCFPSGTLVLTDHGYVAIEDIKVGDMVYTHKNRWQRVEKIGSKISETVLLKGNHYGIITTPEHPFYSDEIIRSFPTYAGGRRGNIRKVAGNPSWIEAKDMVGRRWGVPNKVSQLPIPQIIQRSLKENPSIPITDDLMYIVGRWVGDGWLRNRQRSARPEGQTSGQIFICCNTKERTELKEKISIVFPTHGESNERTVTKFRISHLQFANWLYENFGEHASEKTIPAWLYGCDRNLRVSFLNGYLSADGSHNNDRYRATTVSKKLAHGIRLLGETLEYSCSVSFDKRPKTCIIEGRTVNQKDTYTISLSNRVRKSFISSNDINWYKCRSITPLSSDRVYNIQVANDHSYVVEGFIVHNCQDMSIAGKRAGMKHEDRGDDETTRSGLFFEAIRITNEMRVATRGKYPRFIIWENVPGAFSSNKGGDFQSVLEAFCSIGGDAVSVPMPEKNKWSYAGEILGDGYSVAWRTHDAQYWGVPQRRRRIYVVADLNGGCAREVLFKPESVRGYFAQSDGTGKEVTSDVVGRVDRSARVECLNPWDSQTNRIYDSMGVHPAINANSGGGQDRHGVVYSFDSLSSNSMKSKNPYSGCREVDYSKTIDTSYPDPSKNQGGIAIVQEVNCLGTDGNTARCLTRRYDSSPCEDRGQNIVSYSAAFMGGQGSKAGGIGYSEKVSPTLKSVLSGGNTVPDVVVANYPFRQQSFGDYREGFGTLVAGVGVGKTSETIVVGSSEVYPDGVGTLAASGADTSRTAGQDNETDLVIVEKQNSPFIASGKPYVGTLQANCSTKLWLGNQEAFSGDYAVLTPAKPPRKYIIRRLHPIECARLQGFPDWWGNLAEYDGDVIFWEEVRKTIAAIEGKSYKPSKNLAKWYYGLHTDAAEYKMWGNGIALPFAINVANNIKTIIKS